MNRKRLILVAFAGLAFAVFLNLRIATPPKHPINEETVDLIQDGMTLKEVEAVFGMPPGDYMTKNIIYEFPPAPPYRPWRLHNDAVIWASDDAKVRVHFDNAGKVEGVFSDWRLPPQTTWSQFRGWLGL